jgi:DNA-binding HxlR family transcriptional regulator
MAPDRIYRHFCMTARALEVVGERWSLLIVRDLLLGPRRFTDLARGLDEITPSRLTGRLRRLEAAGVIAREPPQAGREVWYRLTEAGRDLGPVIDALTLWGIEHAREAPLAGEPVHPEPLMIGTKDWLNGYAPKARDGLAWVWRFPGTTTTRFGSRLAHGSWRVAARTPPQLPWWPRARPGPASSRRLEENGDCGPGRSASRDHKPNASGSRRHS